MHEYDVALKRILTRPGSALLRALAVGPGDNPGEMRWLNVELPKVSNLRVDLLGARENGDLIQFEFQSRNESDLVYRMAEYKFAVRRRYGRLPLQIVLYVGEKPMRMKNRVNNDPDLQFRFRLVDARELDGEALLASKNLGDNVVTILTKLGREPGTLRRILARISGGPEANRREALAELSILAGLRRLDGELKRESENMPIRENIMDNQIIGPIIREAMAEGRAQGTAEGRGAGQGPGNSRREDRRAGGDTAASASKEVRARFGPFPETSLRPLARRTGSGLAAIAGCTEDRRHFLSAPNPFTNP